MRAPRARVHLHRQHLSATPRKDLELWEDSRDDVVANQARQALLHLERIAHAAHVPALVLDADKQHSARGVGKGDDCLERTLRGGEIALELEGLAFRTLEQLDEIHALGSLLGSGGKHQPSDPASTNRPPTASGGA